MRAPLHPNRASGACSADELAVEEGSGEEGREEARKQERNELHLCEHLEILTLQVEKNNSF